MAQTKTRKKTSKKSDIFEQNGVTHLQGIRGLGNLLYHVDRQDVRRLDSIQGNRDFVQCTRNPGLRVLGAAGFW